MTLKPLDEFKSRFDVEMKPELVKLEVLNKAIKKRLRIGAIVAVIIWLSAFVSLLILYIEQFNALMFFGPVLVALLIYYLIALRYVIKRPNVTDEYKRIVIKPYFEFLDNDLSFYPEKSISTDEFEGSGLYHYNKYYSKYSGNDLVEGIHGKTSFRMSDLFVCEEQSKGPDEVVFYGNFFIADFNKHFSGKTWVYSRRRKHMPKDHLPQVKLEDPNFERMFVTFSEDQVEARYVLSLSLMSRIMALNDKINGYINLSFVDSKVIISVSTKVRLFEPPVELSIYDFSPIESYHAFFGQLLGIMDDLNLNTRIWTKE